VNIRFAQLLPGRCKNDDCYGNDGKRSSNHATDQQNYFQWLESNCA